MMKPTLETAWCEVSHYLDAALDLEGAALETWLNDLRAREPAVAVLVSSYLVELAELEQENFLVTSLPTAPACATLAGQRFGSYTLDEPIGHGGMATVWLAHRSDRRFEGRAAVKLLNTALVGHPYERRFMREGNVLARLQHPHIAHLLDAGVAAGSQPYLVLEYVQGECIDHYCETRALAIEQRIALFLDVLSAVKHAHSNLIVHRDLKPSNILVTATGMVKLLDFGIAALLSPDGKDATRLTSHDEPGLTPGYAAPEQLLGEPVTTATDVYSLGLILYVLLAGRHPTLPEGRPAAELIRLTRDAETPLPSQIATDRRHARLLRGDLDNIVAMALRRNPAERYTTVELLAQDLRRYLALEPVTARPPPLTVLQASSAGAAYDMSRRNRELELMASAQCNLLRHPRLHALLSGIN
jgi:serine/threonine-protein kinase